MPKNKNQRVLWLLNHTTLRDFEVPLLRELGLEVYTPKHFVNDEGNKSASVSYEYDAGLTIPPDDLAVLNRVNFYSDSISPAVKKILNTHFGTIITAAFFEPIRELFAHYNGRILIRAFGHAGDTKYYDIFSLYGGEALNQGLHTHADRVWLAYSYENIIDNEPAFFKRHGVYLPLGIPEKFFTLEDTWKGSKKQIFFVCPRIRTAPDYYGKIYNDFKAAFEGLPYKVGGAQPIEVSEDENVLGLIPREEYDAMLQDSAVMFYHSQEPRHLHYHPLEAIILGMPLVYMAGGMLDFIAKDTHQPGRCETPAEARQKIERILNGDTELIADIQQAQKSLLAPFMHEYNKKLWQQNFCDGLLSKRVKTRRIRILVRREAVLIWKKLRPLLSRGKHFTLRVLRKLYRIARSVLQRDKVT